LAQTKRQNTHDTPSCPLSKFITTEASQGGVIALTTTKITRQHDIVSFPQGTACRQILWSDGEWTGGKFETAWENHYKLQGYKPTATCKECGFKDLCVRRHSCLLRIRPLLRPRRHRGAATNVPRQKAACMHKDGGLSLR